MSKIKQKDMKTLNQLNDVLRSRSNINYVFCNHSIYEDNYQMSICYKSGSVKNMCYEDAILMAYEYSI